MFDVNESKQFIIPTVAELINELNKLPKDMYVYFNGVAIGYLHIDKDDNVCSFDYSDLSEDYNEDNEKEEKESESHE